MSKEIWKPGNMLYPVPAVMVTVGDGDKKDNIITIAWTGIINTDPAMVYISVRPSRYSYNLIKETGTVLEFQFTSNVRLNNLNALGKHPIKEYLKNDITISYRSPRSPRPIPSEKNLPVRRGDLHLYSEGKIGVKE